MVFDPKEPGRAAMLQAVQKLFQAADRMLKSDDPAVRAAAPEALRAATSLWQDYMNTYVGSRESDQYG